MDPCEGEWHQNSLAAYGLYNCNENMHHYCKAGRTTIDWVEGPKYSEIIPVLQSNGWNLEPYNEVFRG